MEIITRAQAKARGLTNYYTGKPCSHGHVEKRNTASGQCFECRKGNPLANKTRLVKHKYGLTVEAYDQIMAAQTTCQICQKPFGSRSRDKHYDHDHVTGKTRGVLCSNCNLGIGMFHDNSERLRAAAAYLDLNI